LFTTELVEPPSTTRNNAAKMIREWGGSEDALSRIYEICMLRP
jgi:hypothetical protein